MMIGWYYAFVGGDLQAGFLNSVLAGPAFAGNAPPALPVGRKIVTTVPCKAVPSSGCRKPFFAAYPGFPQNLYQ